VGATARAWHLTCAPCYRAQVDYYGAPTPLKSLATISVPDASTLLVSPFDRSGLKDIEKAILESDIGINPSNDGERIRLAIPAMTQVRCAARVAWMWGGACCSTALHSTTQHCTALPAQH
jgi:ribosome recycling factor